MRRSLPLLSRPSNAAISLPRERVSLGATVGIADTARGEAAAQFAVELALLLHTEQRSVRVGFLAYDEVPSDLQRLSARLSAAHIELARLAIDPAAAELRWPLENAAQVTVLAGLPALEAFAPTVAVLLGSDLAPQSWPDGLRGRRDQIHLLLCGERKGAPAALARALSGGDLLRPR